MNYVATAVAISMSRELGPLITAIVVIGRSGSAFAAEIGTMKVTRRNRRAGNDGHQPGAFSGDSEIPGHDRDAAVPDHLGQHHGHTGRLAVRCRAGGFYDLDVIFRHRLDSLFLRDIITGLVKSVMFGITITAVGCLEGLATGAGRGTGGPLDDEGRRDFDSSCGAGRSGLYGPVLLRKR